MILIKQKKLFLSSRSDDNKKKTLVSIYLWKCASILPFVPWYFSDKTKGRFVTFSIVFFSCLRKILAMWNFFYSENFLLWFFSSSSLIFFCQMLKAVEKVIAISKLIWKVVEKTTNFDYFCQPDKLRWQEKFFFWAHPVRGSWVRSEGLLLSLWCALRQRQDSAGLGVEQKS